MNDSPRAIRHLASRVLRPDAHRFADVYAWSLDALVDAPPHTPSARLWSALAEHGWIPRAWPGERARRFDSSRDADLAWPPDLATAITLASDAQGVATVEALLRAAWRSFSAGSRDAPVIRWRVLPRERVRPSTRRPGRDLPITPRAETGTASSGIARLLGAARDLVGGVLGTRRVEVAREERVTLPDIAPDEAFDDAAFEEALGFGITQSTAEAFARDLGALDRHADQRSEATEAFRALRRVWELGYVVDERTAEGFVVLAPEGPLTPPAPWSRVMHLAGLSYVTPPIDLDALAPEQHLRLEREPENPRDPRAIRVVTEASQAIGYVPRDVAWVLAAHLDAGAHHRARIVRIDPTSPHLERAVFIEVSEA